MNKVAGKVFSRSVSEGWSERLILRRRKVIFHILRRSSAGSLGKTVNWLSGRSSADAPTQEEEVEITLKDAIFAVES